VRGSPPGVRRARNMGDAGCIAGASIDFEMRAIRVHEDSVDVKDHGEFLIHYKSAASKGILLC
jgi:hypothetical protein